MIVVHCHLRCRPERRTDTVAALIAVQRATREGDPGCLRYAYLADLEDECAFTCVEEWQDLESLLRHIDTDHVRALDAVLAETTEEPEQIRIFTADPAHLPDRPPGRS